MKNLEVSHGQKLQPLKIGSDIEVLKAVLRKQMLRVGIRAANLPDEEEKQLLIEYVKESWGNLSEAQINEAFTLALDGKLEIDPNPYENFSCMYFGRIMAAYKAYLIANDLVKKNTDRERQAGQYQQIARLGAGSANWEPHLLEIKAAVKSGKEPSIFPSNIYDWMVSVGKLHSMAFKCHIEAAKGKVKGKLLQYRQYASYGLKNGLNVELEKIQAAAENPLITCEAKRMAVLEWCENI